jgi:TP901 family phage tail tape measure protein
MTNRTVEAVLRLSAKLGSMAALDKVASKMAMVDKKAQAFNRSQLAINRTMAAMPIGRFLGPAAVGYAGYQAVKEFSATERSLTRVGLTLGASRDEMKGIYGDINQYAKTYALQSDKIIETVQAYAAAGASLSDIRNDLGLLAKAQQAIDATGADTVNSWDAARKSLGLVSRDAERYFEYIASASAAGKFEGKDMAQHLPSLLPSAAKQGFQGLGGANRLMAALEVMADFTGTAGEAATAVGDFLEKLSSPDVERNLGKISGKFAKDIKEARENGGDMFETMHKVLMEATGGDASKLSRIFGDKEARSFATVLLKNFERLEAAQNKINANAPGVLDRNTTALLDDTQAKLDAMYGSFGRLTEASGRLAASMGMGGGIAWAADKIDGVAEQLDRSAAINAGLEKSGFDSLPERLLWRLDRDDNSAEGKRDRDNMAWRGGYRSQSDRMAIKGYDTYAKSRLAGQPRTPAYIGQIGEDGIPYPAAYGSPDSAGEVVIHRQSSSLHPTQLTAGREMNPIADKMMVDFQPLGAEFERRIASGGQDAGQSIADRLQNSGSEMSNAIAAMLKGMGSQIGAEQAAAFNANVRPVPIGPAPRSGGIRADTGKSQAGQYGGPR